MKASQARDLEILTAVDEGGSLTQRALAQRLGVALGLTNLYLKRLSRKGYLKIVEFPRKPATRKRLRYLLTPKGIAEKTRLTYEHMSYALNLYRRTRETLRQTLADLAPAGAKRIALYGTGDAAELAYLTLKEFGLEPVAVFARDAGGEFLGYRVRPAGELADEEIDRVIVATFERPEPIVAELQALGIADAKLLTLRRTAADARGIAQ
ncbi:MAG TPA: winged helix-turn-helix transcriptional regulator [Methylomirabilota bacterium]|nr:winged helix-turn-helix transcriptional regulator [Methylomirabilota bacterium]